MRRVLGKGYPTSFREIKAQDPGWKNTAANSYIPRSSELYGVNLDQYESVWDFVLRDLGSSAVSANRDGDQIIRLSPDHEEYFNIPVDPSRAACYATPRARYVEPSDNEEAVLSYTAHANRDVIVWAPWLDEAPRFDAIGKQILTEAPRPARNATLYMGLGANNGERIVFKPLLGVLYVSKLYR